MLCLDKTRQKKVVTVIDTLDAKINLVEEKIQKQHELLEETLHANVDTSHSKIPKNSVGASQFDAILPKKPAQGNRGRGRKRKTDQQEEEEAIIADYIANMESDENLLGSFKQRELGGISDDEMKVPSEDLSHDFYGGWGRSDLLDFDDLSTSDGGT